jgi:hypothetical protein
MANRRLNGERYSYAVVDTDPGAGAYTTSPVPAYKKERQWDLYFSVRGTGTMTVTLQFRCEGDETWSEYDTYTEACRKLIEDRGTCEWRAMVRVGDYTSGEMRFGFDW